jgi:hypothetical protein
MPPDPSPARPFRLPAALLLPLLLVAVGVTLSGCEAPGRVQLPDLTFQHERPILLAVGTIEFVDRYVPPYAAPNVEHLFPIAPAKAVRNWVKARLSATGASGRARVVLREASVVTKSLPTRGGIAGLFYTEPEQRYDAVVEATIEILDERGEKRAFVSTRAERSRSLSEGTTLNERERAWFEITEALMRDFDAEMERAIRRHLGDYLAGPS